MGAIKLDLSPYVSQLLDEPFDRSTLNAVWLAIGKHPMAYANTLRAAAKRTDSSLAAAHFLTEAARVHEQLEDIGGAVALLARAWECDPANERTYELLASSMSRLSVRVGLGFAFHGRTPAKASTTTPERGGSDASVEARASIDFETALRVSRQDASFDNDPAFPLERQPVFEESRRAAPPTVEEGGSGVRPLPAEFGESAEPSHTLVGLSPACITTDSADGAQGKPSDETPGDDAPETEPARPWDSLPPLVLEESSPTTIERPVSSGDASDGAGTTSPVEVDRPLGERERDLYGDEAGPPTERPLGERLLGELFEALHEVHFSPGVHAAASFVAGLVAEKTRARIALVHLYDINRGEFVVASAVGDHREALHEWATPESDPVLAEALRCGEAIHIAQPCQDERMRLDRWRLIEPKNSVICAPAMVERRYLGALEVVDPLEGSDFTEADRNAMTYVADVFGKFLSRRGLCLSEPSRIDVESPS